MVVVTDAEVRAQVDLAIDGSRYYGSPPHLPAAASRLGVSEAFLKAYLAGECPANDALRAGAAARQLADEIDRAHGGLGIQEWGPSGRISGHGYQPLHGADPNGFHRTYAAFVEGARKGVDALKATKARAETRARALGNVLARLEGGAA